MAAARNGDSQNLRATAGTMMLNYRPLVEMMVLRPNGTYVTRLNMNEEIIAKFEKVLPPDESVTEHLLSFLRKSKLQALAKEP